MRVGLFCGSLGARSANAEILRVAAARLEASGREVQRIDFATVPPFDPQLVDDAPLHVDEFRDQRRECDIVLVVAPEYAAGLAGSTKNALDWLVGDSTIYRKVVGVASAGTTGGTHAIEQLVRTISWQGGWTMATLGVAAPRTKSDGHGRINDAATVASIEQWVDTVVGAFEGTAAQLSHSSRLPVRHRPGPIRRHRVGEITHVPPGSTISSASSTAHEQADMV